MMISPKIITEQHIRGKSKDEITAFIHEKEKSIKELKAIMAEPNYEPEMDPCEEVRIWHAEECIKFAKIAMQRIDEGGSKVA